MQAASHQLKSPFTIRGLLAFTLIAALAIAFVLERSRNSAARIQLDDLLKTPHVWIWSPSPWSSDRNRLPLGASFGVAGEFFYSTKEGFSDGLTVTIQLIDTRTLQTVCELADRDTVGITGRRSFGETFTAKLYGNQLSPGVYMILVTVLDGGQEVSRCSTAIEFYPAPAVPTGPPPPA